MGVRGSEQGSAAPVFPSAMGVRGSDRESVAPVFPSAMGVRGSDRESVAPVFPSAMGVRGSDRESVAPVFPRASRVRRSVTPLELDRVRSRLAVARRPPGRVTRLSARARSAHRRRPAKSRLRTRPNAGPIWAMTASFRGCWILAYSKQRVRASREVSVPRVWPTGMSIRCASDGRTDGITQAQGDV